MDYEERGGRAEAWPPPHPSPPPAPPPGYGSPGREPRSLRWLWAALGGALAITLFAGGGLWLLRGSPDDEPATAVTPSAPPPSSEPPPPSPTPTPSPVAETPAPAPQARCWDASTAATLEECPMPAGPAGLAWVFPQLSGQQCRPPSQGEPGVVIRVLCQATLPDGTTVKLGYYQWDSVDRAAAYYDGQGLNRNEVGRFHSWTARLGNRTKKAVLYVDAPYSRTLMFRTGSADSPELQHLDPRPPDRLKGEPPG